MKKAWIIIKPKIVPIAIIFIVVSLLSYFFNQAWLLLLYTSIISLFPNEIKDFFRNISLKSSFRVSYSYVFRITINNYYLLVKDEQGRNNYHPVGGVYKYHSDQIDISEKFDGSYDGLFDDTFDTQDDLRLTIKKGKLKEFKEWFSQGTERENISDLSREFTEELIDRKILSQDSFGSIKYKYLGSYSKKSFNTSLKINQLRHYDIINIKLTPSQKDSLRNLMSNNSQNKQYIFATKENIESGYIEHSGKRYEIAEYTKIILIGNHNYSVEFDNKTEFVVKTSNRH